MTTTEIRKDAEAFTITVVSEYPAGAARLWQLWADPRQLERWWGPPTYPATVIEHDLVAGGTVRYFMTGPEGDRHHGGWRVLGVEAPHRIELEDYFADADGAPAADMPTSVMIVSLEDVDEGARMTIESRYASAEAMQQVLDMGMEEGIQLALGQIDSLLEDQSATA